MTHQTNIAILLIIGITSILACSLQQKEADFVIPVIELPEFTEGSEDSPPTLNGIVAMRNVEWSPVAPTYSQDQIDEMIISVKSDPRVIESLGERHIFLGVVKEQKNKEGDDTKESELTFYSYTNNVTIVVMVQDGDVIEVIRLPDDQPIESTDEVQIAADRIAEQDGINIEGLMISGSIVALPPEGEGHGNRIIYITFSSQGGGEPPHYYGIYDLTTEKVVESGELQF